MTYAFLDRRGTELFIHIACFHEDSEMWEASMDLVYSSCGNVHFSDKMKGRTTL
jgi:hypothetical protein